MMNEKGGRLIQAVRLQKFFNTICYTSVVSKLVPTIRRKIDARSSYHKETLSESGFLSANEFTNYLQRITLLYNNC